MDDLTELEALPAPAASRVWREAAFAAVFRQHYARLVGMVVRVVGERALAEEIADDAFWKLYQRPALQSDGHNVAGWLYRTGSRMGIDALRARQRRRLGQERVAAEAERAGPALEAPLGALVRLEQAAAVRRALRRLKPAQAQILVLRHSGLSYQEIALALRMRASSVGTTLARAEAAFQKAFHKGEV
ncbi:MAG TPA: sigma-70 family RNA polymerase sigma factor [Terriglobales bacterium]|nr:sigma-70 family RNA polymerase sigma factor [Terriglobales bacterium]